MPERIATPPLTVQDVAQRLGASVEAVLRWIDTRKLPATDCNTTGKRPLWRISESDLASFVERRERGNP